MIDQLYQDQHEKLFSLTFEDENYQQRTSVLEETYTWDEFIQERSANGDFFFAEATSPDGSVSFGSSNDSQWGASNMATRHCSENSGKICRVTKTKALPRKGNLLGIF